MNNPHSLTGGHNLVGVGTTTFSFISPIDSSKVRIYVSSDGVFSYITDSENVEGPISNVKVEQ